MEGFKVPIPAGLPSSFRPLPPQYNITSRSMQAIPKTFSRALRSRQARRTKIKPDSPFASSKEAPSISAQFVSFRDARETGEAAPLQDSFMITFSIAPPQLFHFFAGRYQLVQRALLVDHAIFQYDD